MSEAIAAPPAAPAAQPTVTPAAPSTPTLKGVDKLMADFDTSVTPKTPAATKTEPVAKPDSAKPDPAKPAATAPAKPAKSDAALDWKTAPEKFRKDYEFLKQTSEQKISEYESRIKQIEAKTVEKPADTKLIEKYQGEINTLKKQLAQTDYSKSDEFKRNFTEKMADTYKTAVSEVAQLVVREGEGENVKERAGTAADLQYILNLPLKDQGPVARRMFGDNADIVLTHRNELFRIQRESAAALKQAEEQHEFRSKEQEHASKKAKETYDTTVEASLQHLKTKWPQFFAEDADDQEGSAALKAGYEFVDTVAKKAAEMSMEDQAIHDAMIRSRAAAFPREVLKVKRLTDKVSSLEQELAKFRKSDPGAGGDPTSGDEAGKGKKTGGIAGMAAMFDKTG